MYQVQKFPDESALLRETDSGPVKPLITLKDEYGGISHIIMDDGCYVLINGNSDRDFGISAWWYPEAARALMTYLDKNDQEEG